MSFALRMEAGNLKIEFSGTFTNQDLSDGAIDLAVIEESSAVVPHRIADLRPVDRLEINFEGVYALVETRRRMRFKNRFKSAIIAPDIVHYGFARMYQTLSDHPQIVIAIFGDDKEALKWLGHPDFTAPKNPFQPR